MSPKHRIHFFKTTIIGGLVFLVPLVVLVVVLAKAASLIRVVTGPLAEWIPIDTIGGVALASVIEGVALVVLCFVAGLAAEGPILRRVVAGIESKILVKVPGYSIVKGVLSGLQSDDSGRLFPVLASFGPTARIGLEIERIRDGRVVVFFANAPNPWSGVVHIMAPEQVQRLDLPITAFVDHVEQFGKGADALLHEPKA